MNTHYTENPMDHTRHVTFVLIATLVLQLLAGCSSSQEGPDCWAPQVVQFSQQDPDWKDDEMGSSGLEIEGWGCLMTCATMALNYYGYYVTPGQFNEWLGANGGYAWDGGLMANAVGNYTGGSVWQGNISGGQLAATIDQGYPVAADVGGHWVLVVGRSGDQYFINDPLLYPTRGTLLNDYGTPTAMNGYRVWYGPDASNSIYTQATERHGGDGQVGVIEHTNLFGDHGVHWYHGEWWSEMSEQHMPDILVQNRAGGAFGGFSGILFDAAGGARKAYWVRTGFWERWTNMGGPHSWLGAPLTREYWNGQDQQGRDQARQDFKHGYLWWSGTEVTVNYYPFSTPGWFAGKGWDVSRSYAYAEAYERNLARNQVGEAINTVHGWDGVMIQDFDWGSYGWCAIIHNPEGNTAHLVRTGFWEYYRDHGPDELGYPCEDEREHGNGAIQDFQKATLYWDDGVTVVVKGPGSRNCDATASAQDVTAIGMPDAVDDPPFDVDGDGYTTDDGDCDDDDPDVNPGVMEIGNNGLDDDCDGYLDAPDPDDCLVSVDVTALPAWVGYQAATELGPVDLCLDAPLSAWVGCPTDDPCFDVLVGEATEAPAAPGWPYAFWVHDHDCHDQKDADGDGFSLADGDCDDIDPDVNPGVMEIGNNGLDDDCDGYLDVPDPDDCHVSIDVTALPAWVGYQAATQLGVVDLYLDESLGAWVGCQVDPCFDVLVGEAGEAPTAPGWPYAYWVGDHDCH